MRIAHFNREPRPSNYTFEQLFGGLRDELSKSIQISSHSIPQGMTKLRAVLWANENKSQINHITGDVHYLAYGLPSSNTILTIHDIGYFTSTLKGVKKAIYKKIWLTDPCKKVKIITAISDHTKFEILKYVDIPASKIEVIPNPLLPGFNWVTRKKNEKPVILQVGSGANKNVNRLIEACKGLDIKLILINKLFDENLKQKLKTYHIDYEQRTDLSFEDLIKAYEDSDLLYFASEYEGFGLPIIEAQAIGRAVITSNLSCMPDIAGKNGAILVDPYSVNEIREAIIGLINNNDLYNDTVNKGIQNVKRYTIAEVAKQYQNLYERLSKSLNR